MANEDRTRLYGGLDASQRQSERRRRLMAAAMEVFGTVGYNNSTIVDICRTATVAPVHFYEVFDNREHLLRAVCDDIVHTTVVAVVEALAMEPPDTIERTRAGLAAFCNSLLSDPRRARIQCIESIGVSAAMEAHRREVMDEYVELITQQLAEIRASAGIPAPSDPYALHVSLVALVGGVNEVLRDTVSRGDLTRSDELVDALIPLFEAVARTQLTRPKS